MEKERESDSYDATSKEWTMEEGLPACLPALLLQIVHLNWPQPLQISLFVPWINLNGLVLLEGYLSLIMK